MEGLSQFIRNLGTGRLLMIGIVGVATFALFALLIGRVQQAPMSVLYSDLDPADASTIVTRLEGQNIPYELGANGRIISVPQDQVDRLRLSLAGEGLSGNVIGKEIFDREGSFGRTSFELNVNFVRAVEGELARTIKYIQSVSEARVHIVMPERRPFQREASEPSASILVKTVGGGLGQRQAQAIQSLVASAIPGLSPDRVTISDTAGRLLTDGSMDSTAGNFANLEEGRLGKERMYREKIESLIAQRVGLGNVRAEVSLQMSMDRTTTSQTTFDPDGQVVLSSNVSEEASDETLSGGEVTVGNNLPQADQAGQAGGGSPLTNTSRTQETTNFENSKTETVTVSEPGRIEQIRVSVIVDGIRSADADGNATYADRTADEIEQLRSLVLTAIPYDEDRGDAVTVQTMRFADPPVLEAAEEGALSAFGLGTNQLLRLAEVGGLILLGLLMIFMVIRPLVSKIIEAIPEAAAAAEQAVLENQAADTPAIPAPGGPVTAEVVALAAQGDEAAAAAVRAAKEAGELEESALQVSSRIDVAQVEGRIQDSALKRVSEIVKSNPDDSAAIVRQWLYAD